MLQMYHIQYTYKDLNARAYYLNTRRNVKTFCFEVLPLPVHFFYGYLFEMLVNFMMELLRFSEKREIFEFTSELFKLRLKYFHIWD